MTKLTHIGDDGKAVMVDVTAKGATVRAATARGRVHMKPETVALIDAKGVPKGDVLATARIAGIMAAKRTPDLIPLCHPLPLGAVTVDVVTDPANSCVVIEATCKVVGPTGVEMEAMLAVAAAALTVYDMCKAVDRAMTIERIELVRKSGGRSGTFERS